MAWIEYVCAGCGARIASMTLMTGATPRSELALGYQPVGTRDGRPTYGLRLRMLARSRVGPVRRGALRPGPEGNDVIRLPIKATTVVVEAPSFFAYCVNCDNGQLVEPPAAVPVAWHRGPRREVSAEDLMLPG